MVGNKPTPQGAVSSGDAAAVWSARAASPRHLPSALAMQLDVGQSPVRMLQLPWQSDAGLLESHRPVWPTIAGRPAAAAFQFCDEVAACAWCAARVSSLPARGTSNTLTTSPAHLRTKPAKTLPTLYSQYTLERLLTSLFASCADSSTSHLSRGVGLKPGELGHEGSAQTFQLSELPL